MDLGIVGEFRWTRDSKGIAIVGEVDAMGVEEEEEAEGHVRGGFFLYYRSWSWKIMISGIESNKTKHSRPPTQAFLSTLPQPHKTSLQHAQQVPRGTRTPGLPYALKGRESREGYM